MRPSLLQISGLPVRCRGIGLLELLLSLIIIVSLLFMATRYFKTADENLRVSRAESMLNTVVAGSYKWLAGSPDFSGLTIPKLVHAELLPQNYKDGININPWGGSVYICPGPGTASPNLRVVMTHVPPTSCNSLLEKMAQTGTSLQCSSDPGCSVSGGNNFTAVF